MKLPFRRRGQSHTRGQALVEMAIILPILALLMVMSLDFGRVFFGWVGLQNVVRIGANFAGAYPDAWDPTVPNNPAKTAEQANYIQQLYQEAQALNCSPLPNPSAAFAAFSPQPSFNDVNGNGKYDLGEWVTLTMTCQFGLITPLANGILGGGVTIGGVAIFPVRGGAIVGIPVSSASASASSSASASASSSASATASSSASASASACGLPIAAFAANPTSGTKNVTFHFTNSSETFGCPVTGYSWNFGDGSTSTLLSPSHKYSPVTVNGQYDSYYNVSLTVTSSGGSNSTVQASYIHVCKNC
jgi:Flp pilus assembly protein TadG